MLCKTRTRKGRFPESEIRPGSNRFDRIFSWFFCNVFLSQGIYIAINWWRSFAIRHLKFVVGDTARQGLLSDRVRESSYLPIGRHRQCIRQEDTFAHACAWCRAAWTFWSIGIAWSFLWTLVFRCTKMLNLSGLTNLFGLVLYMHSVWTGAWRAASQIKRFLEPGYGGTIKLTPAVTYVLVDSTPKL
jgi:hypothetical protein